MKMSNDIPWVLETKNPYYSMFARGEKTHDGRAPDIASKGSNEERGKNYLLMRQSDPVCIQLVELADENYKRVMSEPQLHFIAWNAIRYDSIADAFRKIDFKKLIPDAKSEKQAIDFYNSLPDYVERIRRSGFVVVELKKTFP